MNIYLTIFIIIFIGAQGYICGQFDRKQRLWKKYDIKKLFKEHRKRTCDEDCFCRDIENNLT